MKKKLALGLALVLACGTLAGCGGSSEEGKDSAESGATTAKVIDVDLTDEEYAFGVDKDQPELLEQANAFIAKVLEDGTFDEICDKYFGDGEPEAVQSAELDTSKDQLVVATNAAFEPFEYTQGDNYYGIDMELAALFAEELGQELVIQNMDFDAVCLSVGQHKCDIAMAGLTINDEREELVTFTDSYYQASQRLIVPSTDTSFDDCADADAVAAKLAELDSSDSVGVQQGTTGQFYVEGDADWGFEGLPAKCVPYKNGSLAVQDMLQGKIQYVIIDAAPAAAITEAINEVQ
ncbi:transporter substrate-binding domain-containing protein [Mordavella massiliensis]|jgi:polar amino acid transport system substrate-binding protein|uniref:Transporter substrate-binding domain-containing protein n=1 Tax=Mordavella massiliensis TaxID=1871024 RepID=A0A938WZ69_9CLOT|nr:transporter substrate-binding domain-containing protein [Mordavella massiliensis]MBM6826366.1 transporter substrate-binding domain-containing protein [Mordavella massiliensis]MBM6970372.1 transporter substrate-binding domain-containing protein [Mordavella massiliensis]